MIDTTTSPIDITVVGAGPTGLALAVELARLGRKALVVDKLAAGANTSRAAVIHARTLEVLEPAGITADLLAEGTRATGFHLRERDRQLATISLGDLHTKYPFALLLGQDRTEAILVRHFTALGGRVERPLELQGFTSDANGITATLLDGTQGRTVRSRYLVGCDGMHSVVREKAGITFDGAVYEQDFMLADVRMDWPFPDDEVSMFVADEGIGIVAPLPGRHYRVVATIDGAPPHPSREDIQAVLDRIGPTGARIHPDGVVWSSRFRVHHRVASRLRTGNIVIAGDAAHVHSPAGGQGMNTGIQDAVSLAHALDDALRTGSNGALDAWEAKRLAVVREVVALTDRMTRVAAAKSTMARLVRSAVFSIVGHLPAAQHLMARKLAELDND